MDRERSSYPKIPIHPPSDVACRLGGAQKQNKSLFSLLLEIESRMRAETRNEKIDQLSKPSKKESTSICIRACTLSLVTASSRFNRHSSQVSAGLKHPHFLPRSYDLSVRMKGAANVDPHGGQRAFDQILQAALRFGHRGGLVNGQRFIEQINCLIALAIERLDKLLHPLASLRESCRRHRFELRLKFHGEPSLVNNSFQRFTDSSCS